MEAIAYLHANNVCHRDIKLHNILINAAHQVKIIDFSMSSKIQSKDELLYDKCGTPAYIAPELTS